jgi:hypothetical protein
MSFVLTRAVLLYGLVVVVTSLVIVRIVPLPEIPLLRYAVFAAPLIGALIVVLEWYEAGAPRLRSRLRLPAPTAGRAHIVQGRPSPSR